MQKRKRTLRIVNQANGGVLCEQAAVANTFRTRFCGLLGRRSLGAGEGLLILPSAGVHTFGMAFAIDIVSLDRARQVVGIFPATPPWRVRGLGTRARSVLELPAGAVAACGLTPGDQLLLQPNA